MWSMELEVQLMSLSARERQASDSIDVRLTSSDPKLASLLAIFARLASDEEMPAREKIPMFRRLVPHGRHQYRPSSRRAGAGRGIRSIFRCLGWRRNMLRMRFPRRDSGLLEY